MHPAFASVALLGALAPLACSPGAASAPPMVTEDFTFVSSGRTLSGFIDRPSDEPAHAVIVFVHGSGGTDVRGQDAFSDLRSRFGRLGIATVTWDKPGMGRSEGTFDPDQSLEESAQEVVDAVAQLRRAGVAGAQRIGIWATSRGGWVAPLALARDTTIDFWISVSGVPAADNKYYLMRMNLPLEGRTPEQTRTLLQEWRRGREIIMQGGDYASYLAATRNLREDPAVRYFAGDLTGSREAYEAEQRAFLQARELYEFDADLAVLRVRNFESLLARLDVDVLALFAELDTNVDWRAARALYEASIGRNAEATLTVRTFPGCNHAFNVSESGSVREVEGMPLNRGTKCDGYYETQIEWLRRHVLPQVN